MAQGRTLTVNVSFRNRPSMGDGTLLVVRLEREGNSGWDNRGGGINRGNQGWGGSGMENSGSSGMGNQQGSGRGSDDNQQGGNQGWRDGQTWYNNHQGRNPGWSNNPNWRGQGGSDWNSMGLLSEVRMMLNGETSNLRVTLPYSYDSERGASGYVVRAMLLQNGQMVMGSQPRTVRLGRSSSTSYTLNLTDMSSWNNGSGWQGNGDGQRGSEDNWRNGSNPNWSMSDLRGSTWEVSEVDGRIVTWSERMPTITFDQNGSDIRGFSGVNGYAASYSGDAQNLRMTMGTRTEMAGNASQTNTEQAIFRVLPTVSRITRSGDGLTMWAGDRAVIRLRRSRS